MNKQLTYADYLNFPKEKRVELLDGTFYNLTQAPSPRHQDVLGKLYRQFSDYLDGKTCRVYMTPLDVRLLGEDKADDEIYNIVQPDLPVICAPDKIDDRGCNGSPDLIVEVVSPETAKKDKEAKLRLYREAKVKEYWIVDPVDARVFVYHLDQGKIPLLYEENDTVTVRVALGIRFDKVF